MPAQAIMFHHFHGSSHPSGQGSLDATALAALLDRLEGRLMGAREWWERHAAGSLPTTALALTFDDNLGCQYDVALPVLRERGLTGFFFVYTGPLRGRLDRLEIYRAFRTRFPSIEDFYATFFARLDRDRLLQGFDPATYLSQWPFYTLADKEFRYVRDVALGPARYQEEMDALLAAHGTTPEQLAHQLWMSEAQLAELTREGHVVGLHSHSHPTRMEDVEPQGQRLEYATNQEILAAIVGERPRCMSHPCNSYSRSTLAILRSLGVTLGFCSHDQLEDPGPLEQPRRDHTLL